jgi:hypothetical protein
VVHVNDENRKTILSLEAEVVVSDWSGLPGWNGYSVPTGTDTSGAPLKMQPVSIVIDADGDSSYDPSDWIWMSFSDDTETFFRLTYEEAAQVRNRLNILLENYDKL